MIPADPTTVAIAGDWHANVNWAKHAITTAARRGAEAIVQAGDFGMLPGPFVKQYLDELDETLSIHQLHLLWVDGNHEDHASLEAWPVRDGVHPIRERITHLPRGYRWSWSGKTWLALGGAVSVDRAHRSPGLDWWPDEAISDSDVARSISPGPADVMISHDSPAGGRVLDEWLGVNGFRLSEQLQDDCDANRARLRKVVDAVQPRLLVHGHYHWRYRDRIGVTAVEGLDCDGDKVLRNVILVDASSLTVRDII
ncbi:Calcineurin-like phosphoesterase superfamily domain (plasmid) [Tsukamurella tyrosinosolvens]|uniref:Predicted phosphoesterase n=1 Tax=Tsukamurella tyrosinosolvens TaxID=57704 RepID=A0A1H4UVT9_TSUTY|nr:metallophosphoesterase [Tsukamurella tyrosinosolvens]KXO98402.1 hypothetical protein AXK58_25350 [Tsukamurella tyrosinosolvens]SEC72929.1 Predicted phosphoesterase [Tsukamurella tyrosinosolvens]VEH90845.1 Calcineurin-like phosphoesterase superfamily domain [Tsukamurella tyrosinosolvens]